jgi:ATP phosphoribosyltransferase
MSERTDIRISLPSKGRLADDAVNFLAACGLEIYKPNPRQYAASIPALHNVTVLFQRPTDIVVSVRDGSVDFGITGLDVTFEHGGKQGEILVLHEKLGFGGCRLAVAVPEAWQQVVSMADLAEYTRDLGRPLRVATQFSHSVGDFMERHDVHPVTLIHAEGTLEVAPEIGYADCIADLVSSGQTLRDNRLRVLRNGIILHSQAALIANYAALCRRSEVLGIARILLEFTEAYLRAHEHVMVVANMHGKTAEDIAAAMFGTEVLGGLEGPTLAPVVARDASKNLYAAQIVVRRDQLIQAIAELRMIGGSGVVVTPVTYIFEEEPVRIKAMLDAVNKEVDGGE